MTILLAMGVAFISIGIPMAVSSVDKDPPEYNAYFIIGTVFGSLGIIALLVAYQDAGATAFWSLYVDTCGKEALDGTVYVGDFGFKLVDDTPAVSLLREVLFSYAPTTADAEAYWYAPNSAGLPDYIFLEAIRETVERVGAENFDGPALYETLLTFELELEGYPKFTYEGGTRRVGFTHTNQYEYSAAEDTWTRLSDWILCPAYE